MSSTQHKMNVHNDSLKHEADETFYKKYHAMSQEERLSLVSPLPFFSLLIEREAPQTHYVLKHSKGFECYTSLYDAAEAQEQMGGTIHRYEAPNKFKAGDAAFAEALKKEQMKSYFDISFLNDETPQEAQRRLWWERRVYPQHPAIQRDDFVDEMLTYPELIRKQILNPIDGRAKDIRQMEKFFRTVLSARDMRKVREEAIYQAALRESDNADLKSLEKKWALLTVCFYNKAVGF